MTESKKALSPKMSLAALLIAALVYGGNYVRQKWFGGSSTTSSESVSKGGSKSGGGLLDSLAGKAKKSLDKATNSAKRSVDRKVKDAERAVKKPIEDAKRTAKTSVKNAERSVKKPVQDAKRKVASATRDVKKKASRFSQERKPSRFSQNRRGSVGRTPRAVKWGGIAEVKSAFEAKQSDVFIEVEGTVVHILPLDNFGHRHQNFLFKLANRITLKVSHNIDLAPMLPNLRKGQRLRIRGEYEWNDKGGVLHWTHHDPANRHPHGWIEMDGKKYG